MKRKLRRFFMALIWGAIVGAVLGAAVAIWGKANLFGGIGIGALIGLILGLAFLTLPKQDKEPRDLFPG